MLPHWHCRTRICTKTPMRGKPLSRWWWISRIWVGWSSRSLSEHRKSVLQEQHQDTSVEGNSQSIFPHPSPNSTVKHLVSLPIDSRPLMSKPWFWSARGSSNLAKASQAASPDFAMVATEMFKQLGSMQQTQLQMLSVVQGPHNFTRPHTFSQRSSERFMRSQTA